MTEIPLSQFTTEGYVRLGIKNSRGKKKRVHIGTEVYESENFSVFVNPMRDIESYSLSLSKSGGLVLTQDPAGSLKFKITQNIYSPAYEDEPPEGLTNFVEVGFKNKNYVIPLS